LAIESAFAAFTHTDNASTRPAKNIDLKFMAIQRSS
jgi:hypothetical protein